MSEDLKDLDRAIENLRKDIDVLAYQDKHRPMIAGFLAVTDDLFAMAAVPGTEGREAKLHAPAINGPFVFKTRQHAENAIAVWNDDVDKRGDAFLDTRVKLMTRMEYLSALLPHHRDLLASFERIAQSHRNNLQGAPSAS
jgi:hypothetical protein